LNRSSSRRIAGSGPPSKPARKTSGPNASFIRWLTCWARVLTGSPRSRWRSRAY